MGLAPAMGYATVKGFKRAVSVLAAFSAQSFVGIVQVFLGFFHHPIPIVALWPTCKHSDQVALSVNDENPRARASIYDHQQRRAGLTYQPSQSSSLNCFLDRR